MMPGAKPAEGPAAVVSRSRAASAPAGNTGIARAYGQAAGPAGSHPAVLARRGSARRHLISFRLVALGLAASGACLLPWLAYLAISLPARPVAWHWPVAWAGLDGMEAAGLACTGILMLRRDPRHCLAAAATAAVLTADAWFGITTAPPGSGELASLLMAALAELPAAALCAWLACRGLRVLAGPGRDRPRRGRCCR